MDDKTGKEDKCEKCGDDHSKEATPDEIRLAKGHLSEYGRNFDALCIAAMSGRLGMALCANPKTGEKRATLCVLMGGVDGDVNKTDVIPLAMMIEGNPFEVVNPPSAGVMLMPSTSGVMDKLLAMAEKAAGNPPQMPPTPAKGGMLN
jgi:hypothetical protein